MESTRSASFFFAGRFHSSVVTLPCLSLSSSLCSAAFIAGGTKRNHCSVIVLYCFCISMAWKYNLASRAKRPNLYYLATVVILCSVFYIVGIWQHTRGGAVAGFLGSDCAAQLQNITASDLKLPPSLDFETHHSAVDLPLVPRSAARVEPFPSCAANLGEYTPCEDAKRSLKFDREMLVYRERHCPEPGEVLKCRIPAPKGYTTPFRWPESRESVWYSNVPHRELTVEKAVQNWVRFEGKRFRFPGGGTMFPRGADAYIDEIGKLINLKDGSVRTAIDTGCGVCTIFSLLLRPVIRLSRLFLFLGIPASFSVHQSDRLDRPVRI